MSAKSKCDTCGKDFANLTLHKKRKVPCVSTERSFRESSVKFNKSLSKEVRMEQGIFFTPKKARELLFLKLAELNITPKRILEPSFGSGEFLQDARHIYPDAELIGIEKNEDLFKSVKSLDLTKTTLYHTDFLELTRDIVELTRVDLIIGNPPYFLMNYDSKLAKKLAKSNSVCMTGRPNIYIRFLYDCLEYQLDTNGYLAFVLPTSLYNSSYYQPMRNYIETNTTICHLENLTKPGFYETGQETMLIILQKKKLPGQDKSMPYIFKPANGLTYISPFYKDLYELTKDTRTLRDLGLKVKTGNIVWNQVKDKLSEQGTLLIYASNITNSELKLHNLGGTVKKQYVKDIEKPTISGPVILVERGYGNLINFNSVLLTDQRDFYAENHLNVIYSDDSNLTGEEIKNKLQQVLCSFQDERTLRFVKSFIGNGMISATDLETIIPIRTA